MRNESLTENESGIWNDEAKRECVNEDNKNWLVVRRSERRVGEKTTKSSETSSMKCGEMKSDTERHRVMMKQRRGLLREEEGRKVWAGE